MLKPAHHTRFLRLAATESPCPTIFPLRVAQSCIPQLPSWTLPVRSTQLWPHAFLPEPLLKFLCEPYRPFLLAHQGFVYHQVKWAQDLDQVNFIWELMGKLRSMRPVNHGPLDAAAMWEAVLANLSIAQQRKLIFRCHSLGILILGWPVTPVCLGQGGSWVRTFSAQTGKVLDKPGWAGHSAWWKPQTLQFPFTGWTRP